MKTRKIWSIPIAALALVLMLAGAMAATGLVRAQSTVTVPASITLPVDASDTADFLWYKVSGYTAPAVGATSGSSAINTDVVETVVSVKDASGTAVTDTATFTATFNGKDTTATDGTQYDRIEIDVDGFTAGNVYTVRLTATYDKDITKAATDNPDTTDIFEDGRDPNSPGTADTTPNNDLDGQLVTVVTIYVPVVAQNELIFQVQDSVKDNTISTVGDPIQTSPRSFIIDSMGTGTATLAVPDQDPAHVTFHLVDGNKIQVKANANNLTEANDDSVANITIKHTVDTDLDGSTTDESFTNAELSVTADIAKVTALAFGTATPGLTAAETEAGIHYKAIVPETVAPNTGVLSYSVTNLATAVANDATGNERAIEAEKIAGLLTGTGSDLFGVVNNDSQGVIEYIGDKDGLIGKGGTEYVMRLTASGSNGIAGRHLVTNVKIVVADVDSPPTVPATMSLDLYENDKDAGLVDDNTVVRDFKGVGSDPEGRDLTFRTAAAGFDFDGTKLMVNGAIDDFTSAGDNPATKDVVENNWPSAPSTGGWAFDPDPATSMYPNQTRTIDVIASDGVQSNEQTIKVTITLRTNTPVMAKGTLADQSYETTDVQNHVIVNLNDYISGSDGAPIKNDDGNVTGNTDAIQFVPTYTPANPPFGIYDGQVRVNYPGATRAVADDPATTDVDESWDPETDGWDVTVKVGDAFANYTGKDCKDPNNVAIACTDPLLANGVDTILTFNIKQMPGPPVTAFTPTFSVDENSPAGTTVGTLDVEGATTYTVLTGTGNAMTDFAVDASSGEITVVNPRDYDATDAVNTVTLVLDAFGANNVRVGLITATININPVNEAPMFADDADTTAYVNENAQKGHAVMTSDMQDATAYSIVATDEDGDAVSYTIAPAKAPFAIDAMGNLTVRADKSLNFEQTPSYTLTITASDGTLEDTAEVTVEVGNANEAPYFVDAKGNRLMEGDPSLSITYAEDTAVGTEIADFDAVDPDGDVLTFSLKNQDDTDHFSLDSVSGALTIKKSLDYETQQVYQVEVNVTDPGNATAEVQLTVNVTNVNDNSPAFDATPDTSQEVRENTAGGHVLGNYSATDADGDTVTYSLGGAHEKSFDIDASGNLMTHESLDYDSMTPCPAAGCTVEVIASDSNAASGTPAKSHTGPAKATVTIIVQQAEDSVSTVDVRKANPVPGTAMGDPMSALAGTKTTMTRVSDGKVTSMERPADLPNTMGSAPMNFVETEWASWGTVLLIEVTAESPSASCAGGNRCVELTVESTSGDHTLTLQAFRSASQENKFLAAVELVERSENSTSSTSPVYMHSDGSVAKLKTDEEDEIEVRYGNLRSSIDVENEAPEIDNFAPAHEMAFDDADVDYTFTITDGNSGLPDPEELPDNDGDSNYMPVVALISQGQCQAIDDGAVVPAGMSKAAKINEDSTLYCPGTMQSGEYVASNGGQFGFAPIRDDKDFDDIDDGYDVETTIVLTENNAYFVTFIVCDNAGNCAYHDPKSNDDKKELAQIIVDTVAPNFVEARTGLVWDASGNEYDTDRTYIQVIFDELTQVNPATVEIDDFVVEGHSIKAVHVFENPDDDDVDWADSGRYADGARKNLRQRGSSDYGDNWYQDIENSVFLELEDELLADETPEVTIVPNGVEDGAGNEQDGDGKNADGDDADDWISPKFVIVSIVSPRETSQSQILAGDGDEVVITVTSDERLDSTKPAVSVNYVNAANGTVDTKGTAACTNADGTDGKRKRGEIVNSGTCMDSSAAIRGQSLNTSIDKVSNTEWVVTITEPKSTGYYNFYVSGNDRSSQENTGSEGVKPASVVKSFFDADGDVNVDDAVFFEGDINLPKPNVRVSGDSVTDNEANVEFRSPLFVELDFTKNHATAADCDGQDTKYMKANCVNENSEYAKDNFDDVTITMFELDGVDMTEMVKTTDNQTFLVAIEGIALGDHTAKVQAVDQAGNVLEDTLEIDFEVDDRDPFEKRLSPGWNLVSLPGEPADSSIASVLGSGVEVRTVYTYDPVVPGGWMVAVRETLDSDWQGDLTEITGQRGYWVLSDAIQDWEVNIPRLAGGAAGTGTPIQPPSIPLYAGWNLVPVTDVTGEFDSAGISVGAYLNSLDDGLDLARVLGFDTIKNEWTTLNNNGMVMFGKGYWVFVREAGTLVPGK